MTAADRAKRAAAIEAVRYVRPDELIGVGTGSTVGHFLQALGQSAIAPSQAVSTSESTDLLLAQLGIDVVPLKRVSTSRRLYVDGADEIDGRGRAIKGGGGAHTREKAVAQAFEVWLCIVDDGKVVSRLGQRASVPLDVFGAAVDDLLVSIKSLGASAQVREGLGPRPDRRILDVSGLDLSDAASMEYELESLPGVVTCGLFARRPADIVIVGHEDGTVRVYRPEVEDVRA